VKLQPAMSVSGVEALAWNLDVLARRPAEMLPPRDIRALISDSAALPALPQIARRLLALQQDPRADAARLAEIIELDPLLAAQMLHWANSAYYGLRREVVAVRDAIVALGFHHALALALGLTALAPLQTPNRGPIGRDAIWRHGMLCAALLRRLAASLPASRQPPAGLLQLAGLTHNLGYLLLGHLLTEAFHFLSRMIRQNPLLDLPVIERFALGVEHTQIGLWLFETWDMPEPLRRVVRHHHHPAYRDEHETLVLLVWLADWLLAETTWGLEPARPAAEAAVVYNHLGLERSVCEQALAKILAEFSRFAAASDLALDW